MRLPITIAALSCLASLLSSTEIVSLDNRATHLETRLSSPSTLVVKVSNPAELSEAQRLLTLAFSYDQPCLILVVLPNDRAEALYIQQAANRFFRSDFSLSSTYFLTAENDPFPRAKTLLLSPGQSRPLYQSAYYPSELPNSKGSSGRWAPRRPKSSDSQ